MRARYLVVASTLAAGCAGPHLKREVIGGGAAAIQLRTDAAAVASTTQLQLERGRYDLALVIDVPRAQVVEYTLTCGDLFARNGQNR
jgi:hypothetical protein